MWEYIGPMDLDRMSPKELLKDKVWSQLNPVLQLRDKDSLEAMPGPLHTVKLSNLVCSPLFVPWPFSHLLFFVLISSCLFRRDSRVTNTGHIFRGGRRAQLGKLPRRRQRLPRRRRELRRPRGGSRRRRRSVGGSGRVKARAMWRQSSSQRSPQRWVATQVPLRTKETGASSRPRWSVISLRPCPSAVGRT